MNNQELKVLSTLPDMLAWTSTMHESEHSREMLAQLTDYQVEIYCEE